MLVRELIATLQTHDPDLEVVLEYNDDDYFLVADVDIATLKGLERGRNMRWDFDGEHINAVRICN